MSAWPRSIDTRVITQAVAAEREYVADRAPKLLDLYLCDRHLLAEAFGAISHAIDVSRPLPADVPLLRALSLPDNSALGSELRKALIWHLALRADWDAADEFRGLL